MYNLLLATLTVKVHFMTFRVERILTEITYYFKKIIKNSLQPLYNLNIFSVKHKFLSSLLQTSLNLR